MAKIENIVTQANVVVFASSTCGYCSRAIAALTQYGEEPLVINASPAQRDELRKKTGVRSVPSVWVKGQYVGGCNDGPEHWMGIMKLMANGNLNKLLHDEPISP